MPYNSRAKKRARSARRRRDPEYRQLQREYSRRYRLTAAGMCAQARHDAKRRGNRG